MCEIQFISFACSLFLPSYKLDSVNFPLDLSILLISGNLIQIPCPGSADRTVKFWDLETFELIGSSRPEVSNGYVSWN